MPYLQPDLLPVSHSALAFASPPRTHTPAAHRSVRLLLPVQLKRCEPLREADVKLLCEKAVELLVEEANVQRVDAPVTICELPSSGGRLRRSAPTRLCCWARRLPGVKLQCGHVPVLCCALLLQAATSMASFMT